jgi:hypothetical protein
MHEEWMAKLADKPTRLAIAQDGTQVFPGGVVLRTLLQEGHAA